jgi:DNA-binding winged helix-turn-helix (wHTH) protein
MKPEAKGAEDQLLRFGPFELNKSRRALFRNGIRLKLQQQPFSVLELLIERAPSIVPREDIRQRIWGDGVHVDADQGIAFCIRQIRSVLCDNSASPQYIETIPRQGFRFIGIVETAPDEPVRERSASPAESVLPEEIEAIEVLALRQVKRSKVHRWLIFGPIAAVLRRRRKEYLCCCTAVGAATAPNAELVRG